MARCLSSIAVIGLALCAGPALAQASEPLATPPDIVVEDERPQGEAPLINLARDIAGHPRPRRPLARFEQPLCLMVASHDMQLARAIAARIVDNAKGAKVRIGPKGCKPNALLNLTEDAHAQLVAIRKSGRRLFAGLSPRELDKALAARDPVYVLQASETLAASGEFIVPQPEAPGSNSTPGAVNAIWSTGRLKRETREDMLAALVVIDAKAVAGLSSVQVADYASLRLLAPTGEVDPAEAGAPRTIMTLFLAPHGGPSAMTRFDRAYLRALYRMPPGSFSNEVLRAAVREAARGPVEDGR